MNSMIPTPDSPDSQLSAPTPEASSTRSMQNVTESATGMILQLADGSIQACNAQAERLLGLTAAQIQGASIDSLGKTVRADGSPFLGETHPAMVALQTGQPCSDVVMGFYQPNGDRVWLNLDAQPLFQAGHRAKPGQRPSAPYAVVTTFTQIQPSPAADSSISQQLFATLESISDAFFSLDRDWQFTYLNPQATRTLDRHSHELIGKSIWQEFPDAIGSLFEQEYRRAVADRVTVSFESFYPPLNVWYAVRAYPIELGLAVYFQDVTGQKRAEAALRQSEERYRTLFESIDEGFCVIEVLFDEQERAMVSDRPKAIDYRFLEVNPAFEQQTGLEQAGGKTMRQLKPNLEDYWFEIYGNVAMTGKSVRFENEAETMNRWFDVYAFRVGGADSRKVAVLFKDISERKQIEAELRQKNAILEVINESAPTPIFVKNRQGRIIYANPATLEVLGKSAAEVIGFRDCDLYPSLDLADSVMANDRRIMESGQTEVVEESPDGIRTFLGMKAPYRNEANEVIGLIGISNDISDRIQIERDRERLLQQEQIAREAAEKANQIKDEFLAVLSHELRTPLNPILGWSKLLQTGKLDAATSAKALKTIERNAKLQSQLIEDLLDVSRILRGKLTLNLAPVDLTTTIAAAIETVHLAAAAKAIQIQTILDSDVVVSGDAGRLQQVIWNLLSNAVKFTPENGRVEVQLTQTDHEAQIRINDTGKGIHADFLPDVFEHFRQEDGATTRRFGGLGLGLAIVRQLVELHGGTVFAESAGENLGATFTVRLPLLRTVHTPQWQRSEPSLSAPSLAGFKILVVDDEADSRDFIAFVLTESSAQVIVLASAIDALQVIQSAQPHLLVSDIGMPDVDGYMLIDRIRTQLPPQFQIPAIALTAYAGEVNERQVLNAGFQKHLVKPIDPDALVAAISQLVLLSGDRFS